MSDFSAPPIYSVDSSSLMDWQGRYFPTDVFTGLVDRVEELVVAGRFIAPALVKEEVDAVGKAGLIAWTENHVGIFVPTAEVLARAQAIQNQFVGMRDPKAEYEEADVFSPSQCGPMPRSATARCVAWALTR